MIKNILAGVVLSLLTTTSVSAMLPTTSDTMMKKEGEMMKGETMMKKEGDAMMTKASAPAVNVSAGTRGENVAMLQKYLAEKGFLTLPAGAAYGYFGPLTKKAVMMYQESIGVTPTGFFGPLTRGKMSEKMKMMDSDTMMKKEGETMKGETMKRGDAMAQ